MTEHLENRSIDGPSPIAVKMARMWLKILGVLWLAVGVMVIGTGSSEPTFWGWIAIAFGVLHFVAARYMSGRLAVVFALLGP